MDKIHIAKIWYKKKERTVEKEKRKNKGVGLAHFKITMIPSNVSHSQQKVILMTVIQF